MFLNIRRQLILETVAEVSHKVNGLMFHFLQVHTKYSQINGVGNLVLKFLNMLGDICEIELNRFRPVLYILVGDKLINISLSILPIDI